ncbi:E3 ubiquitin-protein ligase RBBP6-like [Harpia harpyja]|uniref:E3 ubiquitin-protein ligase RBBP6-like n=1 Tax=Harpia harpyja TaxID=202280 RepID=UPI0022B13BC0|nr:E3 ubiquitin-protein ligase RBBP6-like [Harpia harpyja]
MSRVHYKFFSRLNYDTVTFDGLYISLHDLKLQIMGHEKLTAASCDLQITNAQTKEEYTDGNALIPKNSSVIVRRIPAGGVKVTSKTCVISRTEPVSGTSKAIDDSPASLSVAHLAKTANLAEASASEEDKLKAMMTQSCHEYDPVNYMKKPLGPPPSSYTCHRCRKPGHYIKNCPTNGDESFGSVPRMKKSTGIPRSFLVEVKDPNTKGVMLTKTGKYAILCLNVEAYTRRKKEKPPFLPEEPSSSSSDDPIPDEILCLICKEIMTDAAIIPCCGNSYCDECIRTALLESEEHRCPKCHQTGVSPDALVANKCLRRAVSNFKNRAGYRKRHRQQIWHQQQQQLPLPPPPLVILTPPAALVTAAEPSTYLSLSISSLLEEKGCQIPVLRQPALPSHLGPQGQSTLTTGHPARASTICSAGGRPGWELGPNRGRLPSECTQRTQAPALPEPTPVFVPVPPAPSYPPARHALPLPLGVPPPPFPPQFPRGQPPSAGCTVPPPGYPPAPANTSSACVPRAVPMSHSITIPRTQASPFSREEFYREQRSLKEEEKKKSKLDEFASAFAKELMECKKIPKERRHSFPRSKPPYSASSYSRSFYTYSKSRSDSSPSRSPSRSFCRSHLHSYSRSRLYPRRGKGKSRNYCSRSRSPGNRAGNYPEKSSGRASHVIKDPTKSKEKEVEYPQDDGKGNKHKKYQKRRKGDENEGFPSFCEKSPRMEPPAKKVKEELPKTGSVETSSSQRGEKVLGTPQKIHPKVTKDHPETRPAKEEKAKKDHKENDSESNVSAKDEEAAGKNPKDPKEKSVDKVKEDTAAPAAVDQPEASRSQSRHSPESCDRDSGAISLQLDSGYKCH